LKAQTVHLYSPDVECGGRGGPLVMRLVMRQLLRFSAATASRVSKRMLLK
jgi:hypothetical protein